MTKPRPIPSITRAIRGLHPDLVKVLSALRGEVSRLTAEDRERLVTQQRIEARMRRVEELRSEVIPIGLSPEQDGDDESIAGGGDQNTEYYIKPTAGTALHNGAGQLVLEARRLSPFGDELLDAGDIQLFDESNNALTVANGYATGSDGYTGVLDAGDINGDLVVTLKEGASGPPLDTITVVDIDDGLDGDDGVGVEYVFRRAPVQPATPTGDGVPAGWNDEPPGGADALWMSKARQESDGTTVGTWSTPVRLDAGAGSAALNIGRRMNSLEEWFTGEAQTNPISVLPAVWSVEEVTGPVFGTILRGVDNVDTSRSVFSERMTIDPTRRHRVSVWARQPSGDRQNYLLVAFYDDAGNNISGSGGDAVGWTGQGGYHYWQIVNATFAVDFTKYTFEFGGSSAVTIPTGAVSMAIGGLFLRNGAVGTATTVELQDYHALELGESPVYGDIDASNGLAWSRAFDAGPWSPASLTTDLDCTFVKDGLPVARIARRITLTELTGEMAVSTTAHVNGDLATSDVTVEVFGSGTTAVSVRFTYSEGGSASTSVAETVKSVQGGLHGSGVLLNGSIESGTLEGWEALGGTWSVSTIDPHAGTYNLFCAASTGAQRIRNLTQLQVAEGDRVLAAGFVQRGGAAGAEERQVRVRIVWWNAAGSTVGLSDGNLVESTDYQLSRVIALAPATAVVAEFEFVSSAHGGDPQSFIADGAYMALMPNDGDVTTPWLDDDAATELAVSEPADGTLVFGTLNVGGSPFFSTSVLTDVIWVNNTGEDVDVFVRYSGLFAQDADDSMNVGHFAHGRWGVGGGLSTDGNEALRINNINPLFATRSGQFSITVGIGQTLTAELCISISAPAFTSGDPADIDYEGVSLSIEAIKR